jgi:hypothetical protein
MTDQNKDTERSKLHAEFDALPLDQKIASLLKMEATTLSETFAYAMESPLKVVEKMGDIISDFGVKIETGAKKAQEKAEAKKTAGGAPNKSKGRQPKPAKPAAG